MKKIFAGLDMKKIFANLSMKKVLLPVIGVIVISGLLFFMLNRGSSRVPSNLLGMWITNAAGYEDRYLLIQDEKLVFGTGGNSCDHYHVNRVREDANGSDISYIIDYENDQKTKFKLKFVYTMCKHETIKIYHLENIIWTKKK